MSDLYSKYLLEKEGKETIEIPNEGFVTYKIDKDICHVCVLYVDPMHRNTKIARKLMHALEDKFKSKCKAITAAIATRQWNSTNTAKILLFYGFEIVGTTPYEEILLYKEIRQ